MVLGAVRTKSARAIHHLASFGGSRALPALLQHMALRRRQALKAVEIVAHAVLLGGRQRAKALQAFAHHGAVIGWQRTPLLKTLSRKRALLRWHGKPALAAARQCCLPRRRQALPLRRVRLQQVLLLGRQA